MTAPAPGADLSAKFQAALDGDAQAHADVPPPPKRESWLNEDGTPRWGLKADGTPRRSPPGPGRPKDRDDKPRTEDAPAAAPAAAAAPRAEVPAGTYTEALSDTGVGVWMVMSSLPGMGSYAAVFGAQVDSMARAWDLAARKNAAVRRKVERLSGEGDWTWVIPVTISTMPVLIGSFALLRDPKARAELAAQNKIQFEVYMRQMIAAMQPETAEPETAPSDATEPAAA